MTFLIFEKNGEKYFYEATLPTTWEPLPYNFVEAHLKSMDSALKSLSQSRNATWDSIAINTVIFHASALKENSKYLFSDLKWTFVINFLEKIGFTFLGVSDIPEGYPLEEVR